MLLQTMVELDVYIKLQYVGKVKYLSVNVCEDLKIDEDATA